MTVINTNVGALTARTYALKAGESTNKAMERLSSGLRINSAADDAAGLAVANKMESQLRGMNVAIRNSQDGISLVQTAEAGMSEISNMVIRMRELAVQMNNGIYTATDRTNAQLEITALLAEVDKISTNTAFNDVKVLDGTYSADIRAGNTNAEVINVTVDRMSTDSLGGVNLAGTKSVATADDSTAANKVGTTAVTATAAQSVTIKKADFGTGISAFAAANANGTYTLGGADAAKFQLDANNNIVSKAAVDFDTSANPKNTYALTVTYNDQLGSTSFAENISLAIAENKTLPTVKSSVTNLKTTESASVSFRATNSANASDGILSNSLQSFVTADKGAGTYSIIGTDAAQFTIDSSNGVVTAALDYENKKDAGTNNKYDFQVVYTSSTGDQFKETVQLEVTNAQEETVTFDTTSTNNASAGTANRALAASVTEGDVFQVTVDGKTIKATVTATGTTTGFNTTQLATLLNQENAQQGANRARGSFSATGASSNQLTFTFDDGVGNAANSLRPNKIEQIDKQMIHKTATGDGAVQFEKQTVTAGALTGADGTTELTLAFNGETLSVTGFAAGGTAADVVTKFLAADTSSKGFSLSAGASGKLVITNKSGGDVTANGVITHASGSGSAAGSSFVVDTTGANTGAEAVAKVQKYSGIGAAMNAAVTGDTFDVTVANTKITATVGSGVTAGQYGIASLVADLNAANQALATPVDVTFSASGGDLLATVGTKNSNLAMTTAVNHKVLSSGVTSAVGSVTTQTAAAAAVARQVTFIDPATTNPALNTTDKIEVDVNGTTYTTAALGTADIDNMVSKLNATAGFNSLYTASKVASGAAGGTKDVLVFTAKTAGVAANADVIANLKFIDVGSGLLIDASQTPTANTGVTNVEGVTGLVSTAATNVSTGGRDNSATGSNSDLPAVNTLNGNFSTQTSSFVTTSETSISVKEASKIEFGTTAMSAALNTYRTAAGKTGGAFTLSGTDSGKFSIDKNSGLVTNAADMDADTVSSYSFNVIYTDKSGGQFTEQVKMTLTNSTVDDGSHLADVDLTSQASSNTAISILDKAINQIASSQAKLGAVQNRLQHNIDNLSAASMLTETAKGRIVDADFARETTELSKQQILSQAATSMLAQANQSKQSVLALLQ